VYFPRSTCLKGNRCADRQATHQSRHKPLNDKTNGELRSFNRIHPANALVLTGYQSAS
jgi:hypothetical protein